MATQSSTIATVDTASPVGGDRRAAVVIVTYNGAAHIRPCLQSLLASGVDAHQVLVVDNASRDETVRIVQKEFPAVRVLPGARNLGYGEAGNRGAEASDAEYLLIMNQDVVSTGGWVRRLIAELDSDPTIALATPKILIKQEPGRINACGNTPHYTGITTCRGYGRPADAFSRSEDVAAVSGAAFAIRTSVFRALGGFDPAFFLYLEDTDLSLRALLAGYRSICAPSAVVLHDFEPRFAPNKLFFLERNRPATLLKLYRWRTLLLLLPALVLAEAMVWGYAALGGRGRLWAKCRAYSWLLTALPTILEARERAQRARRISDRALLDRCVAELQLDELGRGRSGWAMAAANPLFRCWHRIARLVIRW
jgi:GT2 family glycosyltransferase